MTESIAVRGFAGTTPELRIANSGTHVTTFRLASTPRWRNSTTGEWASGETNWYTVAAFGPFAENVAESINKGDPVVVLGRPKVRRWENPDKDTSGTEVEISAQSVGHDLKLGRSRFTKINRSGDSADAEADDPATVTGDTESEDTQTGESTGHGAFAGPDSQAAAADDGWRAEPAVTQVSRG